MLTRFWYSERWHEYERAYGHVPGTRAEILRTAAWKTRVVDLTAPKAQLWRDVRRSYHSLIHAVDRDYGGVQVFDDRSVAANTLWMREFRNLHAAAAGFETRAPRTWDLMCGWLDAGQAVLAGVCHADAWLGFSFFAVDGPWSYYFSSAEVAPNVNHALIWTAMCVLQARGVERLELGWQGHAMTEKERNIEFFKRGFGGTDIPLQEAYGAD